MPKVTESRKIITTRTITFSIEEIEKILAERAELTEIAGNPTVYADWDSNTEACTLKVTIESIPIITE
jgi:hypothetical protein